jgi:hypothetical protein
MHFPKFWTLARKGGVSAWGWSDTSQNDSLTDGLKRVDRIIEWLRKDLKDERGPYGYPNRPMREEVVREFRDSRGSICAAVTRNSYGCLVLNTARMLFVDVDERSPGLLRTLQALFRGGRFEQSLLAEVEKWIGAHPGWGWRAYRTRAGLRLLATHQPVSPEESVCAEAFNGFGADWLYRKLCVNQKCFRARLTPKPWRCGVEKPWVRWPWPDEAAAAKFAEWERGYLAAAERHATCRLVSHFGSTEVHPELRELVSFHDSATRIHSELPLA